MELEDFIAMELEDTGGWRGQRLKNAGAWWKWRLKMLEVEDAGCCKRICPSFGYLVLGLNRLIKVKTVNNKWEAVFNENGEELRKPKANQAFKK